LGGNDAYYDQMREQVLRALQSRFRPEFLNRVDDIIIFRNLRRDQLKDIVKIQVQRLETRLAERKIALRLSEAAIDYIVEIGYDPIYGARPLKRAIQNELGNNLAKGLLRGDFNDGDTIYVDVENERLVFKRLTPAALNV